MASSRRMVLKQRRTQAPKPFSRSLFEYDDSSCDGSDSEYGDVCCKVCGSGDSPADLLLCDKCDKGYHLFCLRPILASVPKGSWFCPTCSKHKKLKSFPLVQTKIVDFFRIQRSPESTQKPSQDTRKKRKRASSLVMSKKKRKLLPFNPSEDPTRRLEQMASLATALTATGTEFSNDLTYIPGMAPRSANWSARERGGMQILSKEDAETLNLCKSMMERGEWPPLMVVFDPQEGFTVEADKFIKDLTIITEYVGDVDFLKNRENDDGDSMMTLLSAANPSQSLVVCPDKRSNIARFINGINNHTPEGKKKQNLKCVRFNVNGECRVLLIANRDISKGERLYYDYNGYEHEYPTEHFI
ncbi:Methyltransferase [Parasponia andersonii]|uniref:[histone H3]-lysine(27) N-methyltransferase n=1 Tax=Parasponia andersonii TaxID=3476 RepID=A0A2P5DFJ0_PARAD|nr:Methyltransferase [Parasponia andersonii]